MTKTDVTVSVEKEVYVAGEVVKGYWVVENQEPVKVKGINCYFYGGAYVKWTETEVVNRSTVDKDFISHEKYTSTYINLFGRTPSEDGPNHVLEPGRHLYKFEFSIPDDRLPSSFEGVKGAIRYWLMIKIQRPLWPDINKHKCITLLDDVNINLPLYTTPSAKTAKKQLSKALGFGDAGTLTLYGKINRKGYCPGEKIVITATAKNETTKDLGPLKASLIQWVEYNANGETKYERSTIHTVAGAPLKQGETRNWNNQLLTIDAVPPSTRARTCHCIIVDYHLQILVDVPKIYGGDLTLTLPVVIGTVPQGYKKTPTAAVSATGVHELDARSAITYTKCNKGWSYFSRTPKSHAAFYKINYTPMCAYVPNFKFVAKPKPVQTATGAKKTATTQTNKPSPTNAKNKNTTVNTTTPKASSTPGTGSHDNRIPQPQGASARTGVTPSAPPLAEMPVAPPSYEEATGITCEEQVLDDDVTEPCGYLLVIRFKESEMGKVKDTLLKSKDSLEKFQGEVTTLSTKTVKTRGPWPSDMAIAILTFPTKQNATDWLALSPVVSDPNWLKPCDITVVDCKEHYQEGRTVMIIYELIKKPDVDDNEYKELLRLSKEVIGPIRLAHGGSTMVTSFQHQTIRGKLLQDGHRFVITTWQSFQHLMDYPKHVPADIYKIFKDLYGKCYKVVSAPIFELQDISVDLDSSTDIAESGTGTKPDYTRTDENEVDLNSSNGNGTKHYEAENENGYKENEVVREENN